MISLGGGLSHTNKGDEKIFQKVCLLGGSFRILKPIPWNARFCQLPSSARMAELLETLIQKSKKRSRLTDQSLSRLRSLSTLGVTIVE